MYCTVEFQQRFFIDCVMSIFCTEVIAVGKHDRAILGIE